MESRLRFLFICSRNQWRSPTAEKICAGRAGIEARSAGTEPSARVRVTEGHIRWADRIFCMERRHGERLREAFPALMEDKEVICLDIADDYRFMDAELVELLESALAEYMPEEIERNLGEQPIAGLLAELGLKANDLVAASMEHITHKMVARACKGRRLTPNVRGKILRALNAASGSTYRQADLFNYSG